MVMELVAGVHVARERICRLGSVGRLVCAGPTCCIQLWCYFFLDCEISGGWFRGETTRSQLISNGIHRRCSSLTTNAVRPSLFPAIVVQGPADLLRCLPTV